MKTKLLISVLLTSLLIPAFVCLADDSTVTNKIVASKPVRPKIYDETADGLKQVDEALLLAKKDGKRVLLQFGANWCIWCHRLHHLFESDKTVAEELKKNFVVVMVDVNKDHNKAVDQKYGHPTQFGLPVLVVLDASGKLLTTKNTSELESGDHHSPEKVLAFLKEWAPSK